MTKNRVSSIQDKLYGLRCMQTGNLVYEYWEKNQKSNLVYEWENQKHKALFFTREEAKEAAKLFDENEVEVVEIDSVLTSEAVKLILAKLESMLDHDGTSYVEYDIGGSITFDSDGFLADFKNNIAALCDIKI